MNTEQEYFEVNRALWNEKTKHHTGSEFYDMDGFLKGNTSLKEPELDLLGDVKGKSILHLQCHFGQDSLSLARMGAKVTGTDIADDAITYAKKINEDLGLDATFVRADTYSVPEVVEGEFDIVFGSYGVIGWLPDMKRFAEVVAKKLKKGGQFIFAEFHPVMWMYDYDFKQPAFYYFNREPIIEELQGTYTDREADIKMKEVGWNHSFGEVLQALMDAGLTLERFNEFDYAPYNCFSNTVEVSAGKWQLKGMEGVMPMMYSLKMMKQ